MPPEAPPFPPAPRNLLGRLFDGFMGHRAQVLGWAFMALSFGALALAIWRGHVDSGLELAGVLTAIAGGITAIVGGSALADGKRTKMETAHGPRPVFGEEDTDPASGGDA